ncbi:MAG: exonuclease domain-containing protein [Lawsonibacter sp.]
MDRLKTTWCWNPRHQRGPRRRSAQGQRPGEARGAPPAHQDVRQMDALCDGKERGQAGQRWGHPAIAITDHGVVQAFPDAYARRQEGRHQDALRGGGLLHQRRGRPGGGPRGRGQPLDGEIVCFDLETTGLDPKREVIIEIGAVVLKNGQVGDQVHTFVDPGQPLPGDHPLTGITDEMVRAPPARRRPCGISGLCGGPAPGRPQRGVRHGLYRGGLPTEAASPSITPPSTP